MAKFFQKIIFCFFTINILLFAQDFESLQLKVDKYIKWMEQKDKIWLASSRLEQLGKKVVPLIKQKLETCSEIARVGCAKVLINLGQRDFSIRLLLNILKTGIDDNARIKACTLIGLHGDFELEDELLKILENIFFPKLKIELAKTLWEISHNPKATKILKNFLTSDDKELKFCAAIALGEIGNVLSAKLVLTELESEPSYRGRFAKMLLHYDRLVNSYEKRLSKKFKTDKKEITKYPFLDEVIKKIKEHHIKGNKFNTKFFIDAAVKGIMAKIDAHSRFWTREEWDNFVKTAIKEGYVGIGVYTNFYDDKFMIVSPIYWGPSYKAGIRSKDQILEIDGWKVQGKPLKDIVNRIKGKEGTKVKLKIYRKGWTKAKIFEIIRSQIKIPNIYHRKLPGDIGYIKITQFARKTVQNFEQALNQLENKKIKGLIIDLRDNTGGWLTSAVDIVDKFLNRGKLIVYSKGRKDRKHSYFSTQNNTHPNYPLVILVNSSSASASEIVAGTLQYYKRAKIIGMRTFGKGSVQTPLELDNRPKARLKLTIAMYYLPDGRCIHNERDLEGNIIKHNGIAPDVEVKIKDEDENEEKIKLEKENAFYKYIKQYYLTNKNLFYDLAKNDQLSTKQYPDFENWYQSLKIKASKQEVRKWLREEIRRYVADIRGKEFICDYIEDKILQKGIMEILKKISNNPSSIKEYKIFFR